MVREGDLVAIFHSIHRVMKAESILKGEKVPMLLIPAPRMLHADCGLAIRYAPEESGRVEGLLRAHGLEPEEVFCRKGEEYQRIDRGKADRV